MTNAEIWQRRVLAWRASGMTAAEFCADEGLSVSSLHHWAWRLRKAEKEAAAHEHNKSNVVDDAQSHHDGPRFMRVVRDSLPPSSSSSTPIEIEIAGTTVIVRAGFDATTLRAVLSLLDERTMERAS